MTPYLGQLGLFGFNFAPKNWALCNGQLMSIQQNAALFSLLGTTYGGNGTTTFALPNLQGNVTAGFNGQFVQGSLQGEINHTLIATETPLHNHLVSASTVTGTLPSPVSNYLAATTSNPYTASVSGGITLTSSSTGNSQPHSNQSPYLVITVCIALSGIFPSRN
jgi:microcystin-dependent protein